jgi:hypothetical protein
VARGLHCGSSVRATLNARRWILGILVAGCWLAALSVHAQSNLDPVFSERYEHGPNKTLLRSGGWTLGVSYLASVIAAAASARASDDLLYVPVAGPWLDLAQGEPGEHAHETLHDGLLIVDGVVQALGVVQVASAFLFPEFHLVSQEAEGERERSALVLRATPWLSPKGVGLRARATF